MNLQLRALFHVLKTGCAMCFIGHGAFGIITKAVWCNYFAVFGIGTALAYRLMPVVGVADILFGISLLVYPLRPVLIWLTVWGLLTASLRPLSGEPFAELIERAGNYLVPLSLILLCPPGEAEHKWSGRIEERSVREDRLFVVTRCLQWAVFLLLAGHGWLNLLGKPGLVAQYRSLGFSEPVRVAFLSGGLEMLLALVTLLHPFRSFLIGVLVWKMATELFYPHYGLFEWIERGGSYCAILGLWICLQVERSGERRLFLLRSFFHTAAAGK